MQTSHGPDSSTGLLAAEACPVLGHRPHSLPFLTTRRGSGSSVEQSSHICKFRAKAQAKAFLFLLRQQQIK